MLDIKFVRENVELVKENIKKKFQDEKLPLVDDVVELDKKIRALKQEAEALRAQRNELSKKSPPVSFETDGASYRRNCSIVCATPSSSQLAVVQSARAFNSSEALPIATPMPASRSIVTSFSPSPKAMVCSGRSPRCAASARSACPLFAAAALISMFSAMEDVGSRAGNASGRA